jgi:hypothetical protein
MRGCWWAVTAAAWVVAQPLWAAPRKGRAPVSKTPQAPDDVLPAVTAPEDVPKPQAPEATRQEGLSGQAQGDAVCAEGLQRVEQGVVLRLGPAVNFGVAQVTPETRCFPRMKSTADGVWTLVEISQGQAGWLEASARPLGTAPPPPLPPGPPQFEVLLVADVVFHAAPSLLAPVTGRGAPDELLQVHAVSEDGLLYLTARDGVAAGWVLKTMTRNTLDLEGAAGGSRVWAPPPSPLEALPQGSPDALFAAPQVEASSQPQQVEAEDPAENLYARGELPPPAALDRGALLGFRPLGKRPVGRGITAGAGLAPAYALERFQSNARDDPLGNYRLDSATAGLAADVEYHAGFGLVLGARLQGHLFAYTDYVPAVLRPLPEPLGNPRASANQATTGCPYGTPPGLLAEVCPLPATMQAAQVYAGWRIHGSDTMDVVMKVAYGTEALWFGKPSTREPFSDLWYHGVRPAWPWCTARGTGDLVR